jgi:hypothetical protein
MRRWDNPVLLFLVEIKKDWFWRIRHKKVKLTTDLYKSIRMNDGSPP